MSINFFVPSRNELKITAIHQLKYATDQDFRTVGFSRPEMRRLHKFYDKYCSQGYLSKIKRLLQTPVATNKRDEVGLINYLKFNGFLKKNFLVSRCGIAIQCGSHESAPFA